MTAIDKFVNASVLFDTLSKTPNSLPNLRRPIEDAGKNFAACRKSFLKALDEIRSATGADAMESAANDSARIARDFETLQRLPRVLETLAAYKPRPVGALDRRAMTAAQLVMAANIAVNGPVRLSAEKMLDDLSQLAATADVLSQQSLANLPAAVMEKYGGKQLPGFETGWKTLVGDIASGMAASGSADADKVAYLHAAVDLVEALRSAAAMENAFASPDKLTRWVDWPLGGDRFNVLIDPYRQAVADAIAGYAAGNFDSVDGWIKLRRRDQPVLALLSRAGARAEECGALPDGFLGEAGRLATPFDQQPFAVERYANYAVDLFFTCKESDPPTAEAIEIALIKRLSKDLGIPVPDSDLQPTLTPKSAAPGSIFGPR